MMKKSKRYPSTVYSGIGEDPDSWGMCCSEKMARRCAEINWDNREPELLLSIWVSFISSACAIMLAAGGAAIQLAIVWGLLESILSLVNGTVPV